MVEIKLYIPDPNYPHNEPSNEVEAKEQQVCTTKQISELIQLVNLNNKNFQSKVAYYGNIGAGADWPVFVIEITPLSASLIALGALFFSGKKINENLEAWSDIGKKILNLSKSAKIIYDKFSLFLVGLAEINKNKKIRSISIKAYKVAYMDDYSELPPHKKIVYNFDSEFEEIYKGHCTHFIILEVDGEEMLLSSRLWELKMEKMENCKDFSGIWKK